MPDELTAARYFARLESAQRRDEREKIKRYFKMGEGEYGEGDVFLGVRMGEVFRLAKEFIDMPTGEIEQLLVSPVHEARAGALSIMGKQAARKSTPPARRQELYELYLRRVDRINNWDLVDLSCHHVIGGYLADRPRGLLDELARSDNLWERRIAILSTLHFVGAGELDDTFRIAAILLGDKQDLIHKAAGTMLRECGRQDRGRLLAFLEEYAAQMPRTTLRYAMEHLEPELRAHYRALRLPGAA